MDLDCGVGCPRTPIREILKEVSHYFKVVLIKVLIKRAMELWRGLLHLGRFQPVRGFQF